MSYHEPVLVQESIEGLEVSKGKRFIDATFGGGGHTKRMLELGAEILAIDLDTDAVKEARNIENRYFRIRQGNFRDIETIAREEAFSDVDGVLFDLGVSSHQLDLESRGFSYKFSRAPIDLRFNQDKGVPATEIINHETEEQLKTIIGKYGEEEHCGILAHALVHSRIKNPIKTSQDVAEIIKNCLGKEKINDTLSRVFQAFRIYINDELTNLVKGLEGAERIVKSGGRIGVISFHSLEDRIVKRFFQRENFFIITKKPIRPTEIEQYENRRSRSAKLRIAQHV